MIRGAIFDVDGTLLDSMRIWKDASARYLHSVGVTPEEGLNEIMATMSIPEGRAYLKRQYHLPYEEEAISDAIVQTVKTFYEEEAELKPGMRELLEALRKRGIRMVIATSSDKEAVLRALDHNGVRAFFEDVFTCEELKTTKREPYLYQYAAEQIGCKPEETLVIEDAYHTIVTAKQAGFPVAAVYDASNVNETEDIRKLADLYLAGMDVQKFVSFFL